MNAGPGVTSGSAEAWRAGARRTSRVPMTGDEMSHSDANRSRLSPVLVGVIVGAFLLSSCGEVTPPSGNSSGSRAAAPSQRPVGLHLERPGPGRSRDGLPCFISIRRHRSAGARGLRLRVPSPDGAGHRMAPTCCSPGSSTSHRPSSSSSTQTAATRSCCGQEMSPPRRGPPTVVASHSFRPAGPKGADDWVSDVFVVNSDGSGLTQITRTPEDEADLAWSQTGSSSVPAEPRPVRGRHVRNLDHACGRLRAAASHRTRPAKRGTRLGAGWRPIDVRPRRCRLDDVGRRHQSDTAAVGHSPAWAPDGSVIAYISAVDGAIHTISPTGNGDLRIGSPTTKGSISGLDWQPLSME